IEETRQVFDVGVGDGELDLTELTLKPGSTLEVDVAVTLGTLEIVVPPDTRLEVHATTTVGDIQVAQSLRGGVDVKLGEVLEPDRGSDGVVAPIASSIEGGVGDAEVRRGSWPRASAAGAPRRLGGAAERHYVHRARHFAHARVADGSPGPAARVGHGTAV